MIKKQKGSILLTTPATAAKTPKMYEFSIAFALTKRNDGRPLKVEQCFMNMSVCVFVCISIDWSKISAWKSFPIYLNSELHYTIRALNCIASYMCSSQLLSDFSCPLLNIICVFHLLLLLIFCDCDCERLLF